MAFITKYLDLILIAAAIVAFVGFTAYQRHLGAADQRARSFAKTVQIVQDIQEEKNEIRNRPLSDNFTVKRLRSGTY